MSPVAVRYPETSGQSSCKRSTHSRASVIPSGISSSAFQKPGTIERLDALADQLERGPIRRNRQINDKPVAGTQLIREWQGVDHCVTVRGEDYEYQGRPYKSLSSVARVITGTRWNGWVFFGLKNHRSGS